MIGIFKSTNKSGGLNADCWANVMLHEKEMECVYGGTKGTLGTTSNGVEGGVGNDNFRLIAQANRDMSSGGMNVNPSLGMRYKDVTLTTNPLQRSPNISLEISGSSNQSSTGGCKIF